MLAEVVEGAVILENVARADHGWVFATHQERGPSGRATPQKLWPKANAQPPHRGTAGRVAVH